MAAKVDGDNRWSYWICPLCRSRLTLPPMALTQRASAVNHTVDAVPVKPDSEAGSGHQRDQADHPVGLAPGGVDPLDGVLGESRENHEPAMR